MKFVLKAEEMKSYDKATADRIGLPSMVLMERAALCTVEEIFLCKNASPKRVLVVSGTGNNGGDGLAIGRLLALRGIEVTFFLAGNPDKMTGETASQIQIVQNSGFLVQSKLEDAEYDMVVDALFGIGLSRRIEGEYARIIDRINEYKKRGAFILSVDIPSGICADTGRIMGCAVRANLTVTFAFAKRGQLFYPGREYCGKLVVRDIGITEKSLPELHPCAFYLEKEDIAKKLPYRAPCGNKGTFGKVLLLAGSMDMSGACILCGTGIFRSGAGMVRIITPACNRQILQQSLPEAMLYTFEGAPDEGKVKQALDWCDVVVAGPGMGTDENACLLVKWILQQKELPMVLDAGALNLLAAHRELADLAALRKPGRTIMTPHPGELCRLLSADRKEYEEGREGLVFQLARRFGCIVEAKDAVTIVAGGPKEAMYINSSGNDGMATAGSGDVLAGITGSLLAQGMEPFEAAVLSVYLHGLAGECASEKRGRRGVMATDILRGLMQVMDCAMEKPVKYRSAEGREEES